MRLQGRFQIDHSWEWKGYKWYLIFLTFTPGVDICREPFRIIRACFDTRSKQLIAITTDERTCCPVCWAVSDTRGRYDGSMWHILDSRTYYHCKVKNEHEYFREVTIRYWHIILTVDSFLIFFHVTITVLMPCTWKCREQEPSFGRMTMTLYMLWPLWRRCKYPHCTLGNYIFMHHWPW